MLKEQVSIIMPVKNGEKYMKEAIKSIKMQGVNCEIIVIDDGSTDNTAKVAKSLGCKVIRHETSKGPVVAKNSGLRVASGDFIMFHDADDVMNDNVLLKLYQKLESNPNISAVMAKVKDFFSTELSEEQQHMTKIKSEPYYGLFSGAVLIRKSVFDKIGLFNETVTAGEIIDWQSKMNENNLQIEKINIVSTNRRIHSSNFGKTQRTTEFKDYATLLRAKLRR